MRRTVYALLGVLSLGMLAVVAGVVFAGGAQAAACATPTHTWNGTDSSAGTEWGNSANWLQGSVPGPSSRVCIPGTPGLKVPTISTSVTVTEIDAPAGSLALTGSLTVAEDSVVQTLTMTAGHLAGPGTLRVTGTATATSTPQIQPTGRLLIAAGATLTLPDYLYVNGTGVLEVAGIVDMTGANSYAITHTGDPGLVRVLSGGILRKTGVASSQSVSVPVESAGTIHATSGQLDLTSPGTDPLGGTLSANTGAGADLVLSGGWTLADATTVNGATLTGAITVPADAVATVQAGLLNGTQLSGPGTLRVTGSATGTGTPQIQPTGRLLVVAGATLTVPEYLYVNGTGVLDIAGTTNLTGANSYAITHTGDPGLVRVQAGGVLRKTGTASSESVQTRLENDGTVAASQGTLSLGGGGDGSATSSGSFSGTGGGKVEFNGGTHRLAGGVSLSQVNVSGGTVEATGPVSWSGGAFEGGDVSGSGTVTVTGLSWSSGEFVGNGVTTIPTGGTVVTTASTAMITDRTLRVQGTLDLAGYLYVNGTGLVEIAGTTDMTGANSYAITHTGDPGLVRVLSGGILRKTGVASSQSVSVPVESAGTIHATSGQLDLTSPGTNPLGGTLSANTGAGADLVLSGGWTLADATTVNGATLTGAITVPADAVATVQAGLLNGTQLSGPGTLRVAGTATGTGTPQIQPTGRLLVVAGATLTVPEYLYVNGTGVLDIAGTTNLTGANSYAITHTGDPGLVRVQTGGVLRKTGTATTQYVQTRLESQGTLTATDGQLNIEPAGDVQLLGTVTGNPGTVSLGGGAGQVTIVPGISLSGSLRFTDVAVTGTVPVSAVTLAGSLGGDGTLRVDDELTWSSGVISGAASVVVQDDAHLTIAGSGHSLNDGASLVVRGTSTVSSSLSISAAASFDVRGTVTVLDDVSMSGDGLVAVTGTLTKSGPGDSQISVPLDNDGLVKVTQGTLSVWDPLGDTWQGTLIGGTWQSAATLELPTITVNAATLVLDGPTATFGSGNEDLASLQRNAAAGTIDLRAGAGIAPFDLVNRGRLSLSPTSTVAVGADYLQYAAAELAIGVNAASIGQVTVGGAAVLGGNLRVVRDPGYDPAIGTNRPFLSAIPLSGTFARVLDAAIGATKSFEPGVNGNQVSLTVVGTPAPVPPDDITPIEPSAAPAAPAPTEVDVARVGRLRFSGSVVDAVSGAPVAASVEVWQRAKAGAPWRRVGKVVVENGRFSVRLNAKPYRLKVLFDGSELHGADQAVWRQRPRTAP